MLETRNLDIPKKRIDPAEFRRALDFLDRVPESPILLAAMVRDHGAFSYRDFLVGCTVCYSVEGGKGEENPKETIKFSSAANFKKAPGPKNPETDFCAERKAILGALSHKPKFISAIFTVSKETSVDSENNIPHSVLDPCGECRNFIRKLLHDGLISPATRLVTVKDNGKFWEKQHGPFNIEEYAKTYAYERKIEITVGDLLEGHMPKDFKVVIPK